MCLGPAWGLISHHTSTVKSRQRKTRDDDEGGRKAGSGKRKIENGGSVCLGWPGPGPFGLYERRSSASLYKVVCERGCWTRGRHIGEGEKDDKKEREKRIRRMRR